MANGWTGGQYSLFRAFFGALLCGHFARLVWQTHSALAALILLAALGLSLLFLLGLYDRALAMVLACACATSLDHSLLVSAVLIIHAFQPPAPYGSWSARGRDDPGGGWRMPPELYAAAWALLAIGYVAGGHMFVGLGVALLVLNEPLRPWLWGALLAWALLSANTGVGLAGLLGMTFDPNWIRAQAVATAEMIFYDGHCGLCHGAVRFVLAEERSGVGFRFAPLQSEAFRVAVREAERAQLPDSMVLRAADGALMIRSTAVLHIMMRLGGIWRLFASAVRLVPVAIRDAGYDAVARIRHRLFQSPTQTCPLVPAHLRARFDL
jgi:predicted DCC family thiol-disulfide oxidoreductase YuxK